jgi:hypothetical protein
MNARTARHAAVTALTAGSLLAAPAAMAQGATPHGSTPDTAQRSCVLYVGAKSPQCFDDSSQKSRFETSASKSSWVVVGYFYSGSSYSGSRLTVKAPTGSDADTKAPDWSWKRITPSWNNRVRSYVTRNHCDLKGYAGENYTGEHFRGYADHDSYMPHWGGRITSFRMS